MKNSLRRDSFKLLKIPFLFKHKQSHDKKINIDIIQYSVSH